MLFSSLRAPLVALIAVAACVLAVAATPGLAVRTWASNLDVDGLKNLEVTATVVNTGNETLKLLNDPRGVLNPFPEDSFAITNPTGSGPSFTGAKVRYSPVHAIDFGGPSIFTVLAPGDSINVTHDLSAVYDFTRSGEGDYSIKPSNLFIHVDADGTPRGLHANVEDVANVKISGDLTVSRPDRRATQATFKHCTPDQQKRLISAAQSAQTYATGAFNYIEDIGAPRPEYERWFGPYNVTIKEAAQRVFRRVNRNNFLEYTYDCGCNDPGLFIWNEPFEFGIEHICPVFWYLPTAGSESQAELLIGDACRYEANGGIRDITYGPHASQYLARIDQGLAVLNVENYAGFASEVGPWP